MQIFIFVKREKFLIDYVSLDFENTIVNKSFSIYFRCSFLKV